MNLVKSIKNLFGGYESAWVLFTAVGMFGCIDIIMEDKESSAVGYEFLVQGGKAVSMLALLWGAKNKFWESFWFCVLAFFGVGSLVNGISFLSERDMLSVPWGKELLVALVLVIVFAFVVTRLSYSTKFVCTSWLIVALGLSIILAVVNYVCPNEMCGWLKAGDFVLFRVLGI